MNFKDYLEKDEIAKVEAKLDEATLMSKANIQKMATKLKKDAAKLAQGDDRVFDNKAIQKEIDKIDKIIDKVVHNLDTGLYFKDAPF